jgi:hypothetical protein
MKLPTSIPVSVRGKLTDHECTEVLRTLHRAAVGKLLRQEPIRLWFDLELERCTLMWLAEQLEGLV